ncbi:MAG: serine--tRNA ligase, partial [Chloroflexota bacterium]
MLDIRLVRDNSDLVRQALRNRGDDSSLDEVLKLDNDRRRLIAEVEGQRAARRQVDKLIGQVKGLASRPGATDSQWQELAQQAVRLGIPGEATQVITAPAAFIDCLRDVRSRDSEKRDAELKEIEQRLRTLLLLVPNVPSPDTPVGEGERDNVPVSTWGEIPQFTFTPRPHWELGERLNIIDFQRGAKLSGTRFYILRGPGFRLQRALINFMLDVHVDKHGYTEMYLPFMVKSECLVGSGNLPRFADNLYHDAEEDFWFVPTAEVPLTYLHSDEILEGAQLPLYYVGYTACFRREKMAAGKDTRGIKRGHQFDKVELYKLTAAENSHEELGKMVADAGDILQRLGLPHRVIRLCTAELGFASTETYDIEVWAAGCGEWLEVSSCSNCGDFQARRSNIRYRPGPGEKARLVHTLNGSGVALPRLL